MIDPRRLLVLRAVATGGSIAAAARSLHLTPPAVSQQLAALERETGVVLADRSHHRAALTAAGTLLAASAERIAHELADAERQLAELTGELAGPVRVAAFQSVMRGLVAPAIRDVTTSIPAVTPAVCERYGPAAFDDLRLGNLDIVIDEYDAGARPPAWRQLGSTALLFDRYRLVIPRSWPSCPDHLGDLRGYPWVGGPEGTACNRVLRRLLSQPGLDGAVLDTCVEFPSVLALVAVGRGAAIVPELALGDETVLACPHIDLGGRQISAVYVEHRGKPRAAVQAVLDALASTAQGRSGRPAGTSFGGPPQPAAERSAIR